MRRLALPFFLVVLLLGGCAEEQTDPLAPADEVELSAPSMAVVGAAAHRYLVLSQKGTLSDRLAEKVEELGGNVLRTIPEIGVIVVEASIAGFADDARDIQGVLSVVGDVRGPWTPKGRVTVLSAVSEVVGDGPVVDDDAFAFLQWGLDAVDAPQAWAAGLRGAGAEVAILDGGFDLGHPDLAPNVDFALSVNFVAGEALQFDPALEPDEFSHGSHVAGIVAAADNAFGTLGVAPDASLILVKVLGDSGSGSFSDILAGIVYAASVGSDVINMSLGATFSHRGEMFDQNGDLVARFPAGDLQELVVAFNRATTYAYQMGSTVVASAGNAATNGNKDKDRVHLPSDAANVISVSATRPIGWIIDPWNTDLDVPASYTNYGTSVISFAGPGGDFDLSVPGICDIGLGAIPCFVYDGVFSLTYQGWAWAAGTSQAAPHVAGVAALIIGANGGEMRPAHVIRELRTSADDLGKPGKDRWYGWGRVNGYGAVN